MEIYKNRLVQLTEQSAKLASSDRKTSIIRLLVAVTTIFLMYQGYQTDQYPFLFAGILCVIAFAILIQKHRFIRWSHALVRAKIKINEDELSFLNKGSLVFDNGEEFHQHNHSYSYDLDFFGDHSLFQTLNRTETVSGKRKLADSLLHIISPDRIIQNQKAIEELTPMSEWRLHFHALAKLEKDTTETYTRLIEWSKRPPLKIGFIVRILSYTLPIITMLLLVFYFIYDSRLAGNLSGILFLINLGIVSLHFRTLRDELSATTEIEKILKQYSLLLKEIERYPFESEKLKQLKSRLNTSKIKASKAIHGLSLLFGRLEHVTNVFAGPLLNGLLIYHIHVLSGIAKWRQSYAVHIEEWLGVIGEMEQLSSLANFHHNNPEFIFPSLNEDKKITFQGMGHPLIPRKKSVTNSISFDDRRFFVLTGSNMSGKSTFLRTLGINMVLAGVGAPVFASKANVHPLPVLVSMRLSDSLTDSESYFYAEVKRLKYIMDQLDKGPCFVLLDEILRGTNSDDKRNGTIEVIRKMANKKALGGIATHDLEVCRVTEEFSDILVNKRFEVEIVNDELVFDYKLRDGVCENKSASFIMKKMGVI